MAKIIVAATLRGTSN